MNKVKYDMEELAKSKEFEAVNAAKSFNDLQAYFDCLTGFVEARHNYLRSYNPMVVVYSEDVREEFLNEIEKINDVILPLKMSHIAAELDNLYNAVQNTSEKVLSDGLNVFFAKLEIASDHIASARISGDTDKTPAGALQAADLQTAEKPVILAVDDKPELLAVLRSVLEHKYAIICVTSAAVALRVLKLYSPALFLLDIEMPVMNGYDLAKKIRGINKFEKTPIIFLTGMATREHVVTAVTYGVNDYIVKPVDKDILLSKIELYL